MEKANIHLIISFLALLPFLLVTPLVLELGMGAYSNTISSIKLKSKLA
jgi:hypothetical protein